VPGNAARAFRPLAVGALIASSLEARRPPGGPAPGLQAVTATAARALGASARLRATRSSSGRNTRVPRGASLAFRPLAVGARGATSLEARRPPGGPAPGFQAVTTTAPRASAPRASASSGLPSGRNTRVTPPRDRGISPARALGGRRCAAAHGAHAGRE
jgi:hypothetical protein